VNLAVVAPILQVSGKWGEEKGKTGQEKKIVIPIAHEKS